MSVDSDGDVKVAVAGSRWTFNPQCLIMVSEGADGAARSSSRQTSANSSDESDSSDDDSMSKQTTSVREKRLLRRPTAV